MPIQFPSNPVRGQRVLQDGRSWVWDGSAWAIDVAAVFTGDTPPSTAANRQFWLDTATGELRIKYNDIWVELGSYITPPE